MSFTAPSRWRWRKARRRSRRCVSPPPARRSNAPAGAAAPVRHGGRTSKPCWPRARCWHDLFALGRRAGGAAWRAGAGKILRRHRAAGGRARQMVEHDRRQAEHEDERIDEAHGDHSRERPNHGRSRMPTVQPASAEANHTQPCSEPDATPPTKAPMLQPKPSRAPQPISRPPSAAATSDFSGGQSARANGRTAAAAAMAPRIMPKSVRLDVSVRTESVSARFGPGHCQNGWLDKSKPRPLAILAPHTVKPKVTLHGWRPATNTAIDDRPMATAPITMVRLGRTLAPRRRASAPTIAAAIARLANVAASPPHGPRYWLATIGSAPPSARNAGRCRLPITLPTTKKASAISMRPEPLPPL